MCEAGSDPATVDFALLSHPQRVEALTVLQRQRAALDAREQRLLHAMHADPVPGLDGDPARDKYWVREDVACVLRIAPQTAAAKLHTATDLITRLPATLAMLERGELTLRHATRLVEATIALPEPLVQKVENRVLTRAGQQSLAQFTAAVRRAVAAADPRGADERHKNALEQRRVLFTPQPDGITEQWALLPAAGAAALHARLTADADRLKQLDTAAGISRTADQRRADALIALALDTTPTAGDLGGPGSGGGLKPAINVTVALSTLLGTDNQPGDLDGYGPIPATLARALAFDPTGTWRRLLTDQAGRLIDVTSHTYRPPAPIARLVRLQHQTCCFPGCRRAAVRCDLDHIQPWPHGATCPANLQPLCPRHHHLKHETDWHVHRDPDGTTRWTSPSGHTYARPPDELPIDTTTKADLPTDPPQVDPLDDDPPPF
jgi:hypothetical protein